MFDFIDLKTVFLITHLFGVAIGAGGAFTSDAMFFKSVRDERISKTELGFLTLGSSMVIIGLIFLILSGAGLFFLDMEMYLSSSKFLSKMTIVLLIVINGVIFHKSHLPRLFRHLNHHLPSSDEFIRHRVFLLSSGVVSAVSWTFAIILGTLRDVPYSYTVIMLTYLLILSAGVCFVYFAKNWMLIHHRKR
ncbi:MAG: hypothetical protein COU90_01765 [Candidatus Ryanbacteria bacterium CG10_big_fil_rev_8_21_14_0_10_43_42]|uniref:DUF2214 domain-containing protein n=1 Tax=Candidatus Ryanbacteria bacterium CG10_big_fil_rev_8_21_14_0_10_43_42 TaxID=1974864 RepID=A0A2M8KXC4_9BACT|nr:MAG: hypothetical protein COU90_01765 [Candidatus Ryanbacteria bacterium CG10_big_fil_rev_8_21_14_0_10_43_42]